MRQFRAVKGVFSSASMKDEMESFLMSGMSSSHLVFDSMDENEG
jgi:hypothetical protein